MTKFVFANNATAQLRDNVNESQIAFRVTQGLGALFPAPLPEAGELSKITVEDRRTGQREIMNLVSRAGDLFYVQRGQEGTLAQNFLPGATVSHRLTRGLMEYIQSAAMMAGYFLGASSQPPTAMSTGDDLVSGALYYNTVTHKVMVYSGSGWVSFTDPVLGSRTEYEFISADGQTEFSVVGETQDYYDVFINGLRVPPSQFAIAEDRITLLSPPSTGSLVHIIVIRGANSVPASYAKKLATDGWILDGLTVTFPLVTPYGVSVIPTSASNILLVLDGILQQADRDYSVLDDTITFTEAPPSGTSIFALAF